MDQEPKSKEAVESEVWNAISAFEQILEAIPTDRVSLETLYDAYEQIGDRAKALEYLMRLAGVVADEMDVDAAPDIVNKLNAYAADSPAVKPMLNRLERLLVQNKMPAAAPAADTAPGESARRKAVDIPNELALAWNLLQAGILSQEEYSNVVHDLSENSSKNVQVPVSVMHVLHDRGFKGIEKVIRFLCKDSGLSFIPLSSFEFQKENAKLLPLSFAASRGALVFELMGDDALVALLNPYDTELRAEIKRTLGKVCHFYIVTAEEYDGFLEKIRKSLAETTK